MDNKVITKSIVLADGCVVMVGYQTDNKGTQTGFVEVNHYPSPITSLLDNCDKVIDVVEVFDNVILLALLQSNDQYSNHVHFIWRRVFIDNSNLPAIDAANDYPQLLTTDKLCKFVRKPKSIMIVITDHRMMLMLNAEGVISGVKSIESDDECNSEYYTNGRFKLDHIEIIGRDLRLSDGKPSAEVIVQFTDIIDGTIQRDILWIRSNLSHIVDTVINHDKLVITYTTKDDEYDYDKYHVFIQPYTVISDSFTKSGIGYSIELS